MARGLPLFAKEHDASGAPGGRQTGTPGEKSGGTTASITSAPPTAPGLHAWMYHRSPPGSSRHPREVGVPYGQADRPARPPPGPHRNEHLRSGPPYLAALLPPAGVRRRWGRRIANISLSRQAGPPARALDGSLPIANAPPGPQAADPEPGSRRARMAVTRLFYRVTSIPRARPPSQAPSPGPGGRRPAPRNAATKAGPRRGHGARAPGLAPPSRPPCGVRRWGPATSAGPHGRGPGRRPARPPRSARPGS